MEIQMNAIIEMSCIIYKCRERDKDREGDTEREG